MTLKLFELVGTDPARPYSPFCWRTRMALAHKGLVAETIPWRLTERSAIGRYKSEKVPVLLDGEKAIVDSWDIANYLEDAYPDRPSLFGGQGGRSSARFLNGWGDMVVVAGMFPFIIADIVQLLRPADHDYFRKKHEARSNMRLEDMSADRDSKVEGFRKTLEPLRLMLRTQPFIGGDAPNYGDYIVFGAFQWARVVSPFCLLMQDDPVHAWRERLLDAYGGVARKSPGFAV
jgi:glutathione S-transferase